MKRAQAEIMGLLLIVIIIALGFIFYLRFVAKDDGGSTIIQDFKEDDLGNSFVASISKSTVECGTRQLPVKTILAGIVQGNTICSNQEDVLRTYFKTVLENTLKPMGINYNFTILKGTSMTDPGSLTIVQDYSFKNEDFSDNLCGLDYGLDYKGSRSMSQNIIATRGPEQVFVRLLICS